MATQSQTGRIVILVVVLALFGVDAKVVDGLVNLQGYVNKRLGFAAAWTLAADQETSLAGED